MGAGQSALLDQADPEEVGLRLVAALRARWFGSTDESAHSKADLQADAVLVGGRNMILDISSTPVPEFLAAESGTPARRELTDAFWEFGAFKPFALAAVKADPKLSRLAYKCVPKHRTESEFWRLWFVHVYAALSEACGMEPMTASVGHSVSRSSMTSPKRLAPIELPRANSVFLRQEPWARIGGECVWLLSDESAHVVQGRMVHGAGMAEGPQPGVAAFSFASPSAMLELGAPAPLDPSSPSADGEAHAQWTVCAWILVDERTPKGERCLACGSAREQVACLHEGELGLRTGPDGSFHSSGFNLGAVERGWFHLTAVGLRGKTTFYLNGMAIGTVEAQCTMALRFVGNVPGPAAHPFGTIADFRAFHRSLDEAEIVALANMVPDTERPRVPSTQALVAFARKHAVASVRNDLERAAKIIASADAELRPLQLPAVAKSACDLATMSEQLRKLAAALQA
jgi:hypothetical protein